jgi:hypothetical protein
MERIPSETIMKLVKRITYSKGISREVEGRLLPFKDEVDLFNVGRKWWLAYKDNIEYNTGSFNSKKAAIAWYTKGGR